MPIMRKVFKLVTLFMGEVDLIIRGKLAHDALDLSGPLFLQKLKVIDIETQITGNSIL